ncbi:MAG: ABC transporter substrate-binding protein [Actinomycetes bacterium]
MTNKGEFMQITKSRSYRASIAICLSFAFLAASCGSDSGGTDAPATDAPTTDAPTTDAPATPVAGGTLRYGVEAETNGLNPTSSAFAVSAYVMGNAVFDTLTALAADGSWVPNLAASLTPSADLKDWTLVLRPGILFHDGTPLNSAAVKANFDAAYAAPLVGLAVRPFYPAENAVEIVDDLTLIYHLLDANLQFPHALRSQLGMVASPTWLAAAIADPTLNQAPVGTGPFKFDSRTQDSVTRFVRNDSYWGGEVLLDAIEFVPVVDPATRLELLQNGELDAMHTTETESLAALRADTTLQNIIDDNGEENFVMINSAKAPFDDIRVRKAIALATPRMQYNTLFGNGEARLADQRFTPESPYYDETIKQEADDPAAALALVAEYCAEGLLTAEGTPTCTDGKVNMEWQYTGPSVVGQRITDLFNASWGAAGFNVTNDELAQDDHIQQAALGQYNVIGWRQFGAYQPSTDAVWLLCRTIGGISLNWPRYCDPARDTLLLEAQVAPTQADEVPLQKKISQNIHDAYTYIFLQHSVWDNSFTSAVHGTCDVKSPEGVPLACAINGATAFTSTWMS